RQPVLPLDLRDQPVRCFQLIGALDLGEDEAVDARPHHRDEVAEARKIIDAFRRAEAAGLASIQVDGRFVDYPIAYQAERVLQKVDCISARRPAA
ncbi:MAG: hypothetical protein M3145_07300, partial [Pseudomonadota bacterium]|nr:hypothetical protein [Pseudomonadota bacterium]